MLRKLINYFNYNITFLVLTSLIFGGLGYLLGIYLANPHSSVLGMIGTILGALLGVCISRSFYSFDKKHDYLVNSQGVLLLLSKQLNEFENIKAHFNKYKDNSKRHLQVPSLIVSDNEWRLSKKEIFKLNKFADQQIVSIIWDLILLDKNFKDLLLAINDYNNIRNPLVIRWQNGVMKCSNTEEAELKRLLNAVYNRIAKIDFLKCIDVLYDYLKEKLPLNNLFKPTIR